MILSRETATCPADAIRASVRLSTCSRPELSSRILVKDLLELKALDV